MRACAQRLATAAFAFALAWATPLPPPAHAETLSSVTTDHRTILNFRVPEETVRRLLPAGWQSAPLGSGPAQGANLVLLLIDQIMAHDAQGKPATGGTNQFVVLAVPARNAATGAAGAMVIDGFSAKSEGAPGAYGAYEPAEVRLERAVQAGPGDARRSEERWTVAAQGAGGNRLEVRLRYAAATPSRATSEVRVYSARNPDFYRIYRVEQGVNVLRSAPTDVDRVEEFAFAAAGPRLGALFDGSERLVAIISLPAYARRIFLP